MPGHTPGEQAKNAADVSIRPGPDTSGGAAAVSDDAGFQSRFTEWKKFFARPDVQAGLLQFGAQMLQTNPGGFAPAFGTSVSSGLAAAGRFQGLEREQKLGTQERADATRQQQLENELAERRVATQEERTGILGRRGAGGGGGVASIEEEQFNLVKSQWITHFGQEIGATPDIVESKAHAAATAQLDGTLQAARAVGKTLDDVLENFLAGPDAYAEYRAGLGLGLENVAALPKVSGSEEGAEEVEIIEPKLPPSRGSRGGIVTGVQQVEAEITRLKARLAKLLEKGSTGGGRGGKVRAQATFDRKVAALRKRIAEQDALLNRSE